MTRTAKGIPTEDFDTGLERDERLHRKTNMPHLAYLEVPLIEGPMGTPSKPTIVYSIFDSRIIGCRGDGKTRVHDTRWHSLKEKNL